MYFSFSYVGFFRHNLTISKHCKLKKKSARDIHHLACLQIRASCLQKRGTPCVKDQNLTCVCDFFIMFASSNPYLNVSATTWFEVDQISTTPGYEYITAVCYDNEYELLCTGWNTVSLNRL